MNFSTNSIAVHVIKEWVCFKFMFETSTDVHKLQKKSKFIDNY